MYSHDPSYRPTSKYNRRHTLFLIFSHKEFNGVIQNVPKDSLEVGDYVIVPVPEILPKVTTTVPNKMEENSANTESTSQTIKVDNADSKNEDVKVQ